MAEFLAKNQFFSPKWPGIDYLAYFPGARTPPLKKLGEKAPYSLHRSKSLNFDDFKIDLEKHFNAEVHPPPFKTIINDAVRLDKVNFSNKDEFNEAVEG